MKIEKNYRGRNEYLPKSFLRLFIDLYSIALNVPLQYAKSN